MNTQIIFTVKGHLAPFNLSVVQSMTIEQAKAHVQQLVDQRGMTFRGKRATVSIISVITK